jgi:hypothetical protein
VLSLSLQDALPAGRPRAVVERCLARLADAVANERRLRVALDRAEAQSAENEACRELSEILFCSHTHIHTERYISCTLSHLFLSVCGDLTESIARERGVAAVSADCRHGGRTPAGRAREGAKE